MEAHSEVAARRWNAWDLALVTSFLAALLAPAIDQVIRPDAKRGPEPENRPANPVPEFPRTWDAITNYPTAYEAYYRDTFGLRDVLLAWNSILMHYVFGIGTAKTLVPFSRDWINYDGDSTILAFRGLVPFREVELEAWQTMLEKREAELANNGIKHLYVIVPNKETIYPERVPSRYNRVGPTRLDQLVDWMAAHSNVRILDMRPQFLAEKVHDEPENYLYNPIGTHWGGRGIYVAYKTIANRVREMFPATRVLTTSEFRLADSKREIDSWALRMYIPKTLIQHERYVTLEPGLAREALLVEPQPTYHTIYANQNVKGPRVYFYHDSFGASLFLPSSATYARFETMQTGSFDMKQVVASHSDLVIEMFVERHLVTQFMALAKPPPTLEAAASDSDLLLSSSSTRLKDLFLNGNRVVRGEDEAEAVSTVWFDVKGTPNVEITLGLENTEDGALDVYWRNDPLESFRRARRTTVQTKHGTERATAVLESIVGPRCQLLLRASTTRQVSKIRWFELRTVPRGP